MSQFERIVEQLEDLMANKPTMKGTKNCPQTWIEYEGEVFPSISAAKTAKGVGYGTVSKNHIKRNHYPFDTLTAREIADTAVPMVLNAIREGTPMNYCANSIGDRLYRQMGMTRGKYGVYGGMLVIEAMMEARMFSRNKRRNTKNRNNNYDTWTFTQTERQEERTEQLWDELELSKSYSLPLAGQADDWEGPRNKHGEPLVKNADRCVDVNMFPKTCNILFSSTNKQQAVAWGVNGNMFNIVETLYNQGDNVFKQFREKDGKKVKSLKQQTEGAIEMARKVLGIPFHHKVTLDFRSRCNLSTRYFNHQGADAAKGMLEFWHGKALGLRGEWELYVHTSNVFGFDKAKRNKRRKWTSEHLEQIIECAADPMANTWWKKADKPFTFLRACLEIAALEAHKDQGYLARHYVSHIWVDIDATCSGLQLIAGMIRDETLGRYVNLVPCDTIGDIYTIIGKSVFDDLATRENIASYEDLEQLMSEIKEFQDKFTQTRMMYRTLYVDIHEAENAFWQWFKDEGKEKSKAFYADRADRIEACFEAYWLYLLDHYESEDMSYKFIRNTAKRPVMVINYGCGYKTMGSHMMEDLQDKYPDNPYIDLMQHKWARMMGKAIYEACERELAPAMEFMGAIAELARSEAKAGRKFAVRAPLTNFPMVQKYKNKERKVCEYRFRKNEGLMKIVTMTNTETLNVKKSKTSSLANTVHLGDATVLHLTVDACDFDVAGCHDSFICHPADMPKLFRIVREQFVRYMEADPALQLFKAYDRLDLMPDRGDWDPKSFLKSEFGVS